MSTPANMSLQEFIDGIKVDSQSGEVGNNLDTTAAAILRQLNQVREEFWEKNDWDWSKTAIALTVAAGLTTKTTLPATIGRIITLGIVGQSGEIQVFTEREYREWRKLNDPDGDQTGSVIGVVLKGYDASGNLQVLFVNPPSSATSIEGEGKTRLNPVRYSVAQIATVTSFDYFPDEVVPLLYDWTYGKYLKTIKDVRGDGVLYDVQTRLTRLMGTQRSQPLARSICRPPDYIRFVNSKRGGRTTA